MPEVIWQLPVIQSNVSDNDWIHPKAKYHAFIGGIYVCGKGSQDTSYFETSIEEDELMKNKNLACKKCMNKLGIVY